MPWNKEDYPDSLKNFTAPVRNKAIATAQAKEWGENQAKQIRKKGH